MLTKVANYAIGRVLQDMGFQEKDLKITGILIKDDGFTERV